ncbi:hypothetical protein M8C21_003480, partial [Ambrosia artemisiifolia]
DSHKQVVAIKTVDEIKNAQLACLFYIFVLSAYTATKHEFLWGLGLPPGEAECNDVYGLDEELLEMVPKPVLAVLFLYPITPESEQERLKQDCTKKDPCDGVYFMRQTSLQTAGAWCILNAAGCFFVLCLWHF